jgi:hypothetical protein
MLGADAAVARTKTFVDGHSTKFRLAFNFDLSKACPFAEAPQLPGIA